MIAGGENSRAKARFRLPADAPVMSCYEVWGASRLCSRATSRAIGGSSIGRGRLTNRIGIG
jgi:hypothetical protein